MTPLTYLHRLLATPYRWGGDDPLLGFDCSGLVIEWLQATGVLPRGYEGRARDLHKRFAGHATTGPLLGTLLFFGEGLEAISHVAIATDDFYMIEAGGGGSKTTDAAAAARDNAFVRVRPISWRRDLVAMVHPPYPRALNGNA
jgi:cell wall-associated NlpC family hydrolase